MIEIIPHTQHEKFVKLLLQLVLRCKTCSEVDCYLCFVEMSAKTQVF